MVLYESRINKQVYTQPPVFDIRMYNLSGVLVEQVQSNGSTVQIDVSTLPKGYYVIHIYDGITSTPEVHKIQVN
jgi:hypothetical protein